MIGVLERLHVLVPVGPLGDVGGLELPLLAGCVQAGDEPPLLLLLRHVEEELHDLGPAAIQVALERVDVVVASLPELLAARPGRELLTLEPFGMHPQRDDLLVVRAVEDADPPPLGQGLADAPEEVVVELLAGGLPEGDDVDALRVHARHHVLDRRVLARRVERLEDDQERVGVARPQELLSVRELHRPLASGSRGRCSSASSRRAARTRRPRSRRGRAAPGGPACRVRQQHLPDTLASAHRCSLPSLIFLGSSSCRVIDGAGSTPRSRRADRARQPREPRPECDAG